MHRVELKVRHRICRNDGLILVPNAPCGVESNKIHKIIDFQGLFLMHRVELKVRFCKDLQHFRKAVPNAPCGVESSFCNC